MPTGHQREPWPALFPVSRTCSAYTAAPFAACPDCATAQKLRGGGARRFCLLAGGFDCREQQLPAGVPSVDGYDMWPYLVGDAAASPRTEIMLETGCKALGCAAPGCVGCNAKLPCGRFPCTGALISGDFKIILGMQSYGFWQGPIYPASSRRCVFPVAALISLTQTAAGRMPRPTRRRLRWAWTADRVASSTSATTLPSTATWRRRTRRSWLS